MKLENIEFLINGNKPLLLFEHRKIVHEVLHQQLLKEVNA